MPPLLALLLLLVTNVDAASWDPDLRWRSLRTDHFVVTFHQGEERLAEEMADAAERAWDVLVPEIGNAPRERIELVLVDWTDSANGYATIVPRNTIVIYVTAPEEDSTLGLYEDWSSGIVTHELTHILHMDTVEGLPRVARAVMGSFVSTHQVSPNWIVEGYATFEETRMSRTGRGRHAVADMIKRTAVLEDRFPPLGNLDGYQSLPPGGNLRYLFGQDFIQFVADTRGEDKWTEWVHNYGRSIPFLLPARRTFGATFQRMYREWRDELERRYAAQAAAVAQEGLTDYTVVSAEGQACGTPAFSPEGGHVVYACTDPREGQRIWMADADGTDAEVLVRDRFARTIAWRGDGGAFAYSTAHDVGLYNQYDDIYLYEVRKKRTRALTSGARARDPSFSPDGSRMVVVTNEAQENRLQVLTVDGQLRPLTEDGGHTQFGTPRFSPDGRLLAVSVWAEGLRDLWIYTSAGTPWRRLTYDAHIDREPAWSADGRWLYFTSDRSGIPNVYALELATERLYRVTNVVTGAYGASPHPDGKRLAMQVYRTAGPAIAVMDLDPARFKDVGALPVWPGQPAGALGGGGLPEAAPLPAPVAKPLREEEPHGKGQRRRERVDRALTNAEGDAPGEAYAFRYPVKPYDPLRTLFPPRYWLPGAYLTSTGDSYGLLGAASTSGADTLRHLAYSAYATYRTDARYLGGGGSLAINRWRPVFSFAASTQVTPYGDVYVSSSPPEGGGATIPTVESARVRYWDRRVRASAAMGYPLTEHSSLTAFWSGTLRSPLDPLPDDAYLPALPTRGFFSTVGTGWRYGKGSSYALSISPEDARSVAFAAELTPRWLGSWTYDDTGAAVPFDQLQVTAEWREYTAMPWLKNHVFATKLSGGATVGDRFRYGSFRLGGSFSESGITVVPSEWRMLRGFFPASDSGEWYWLGSAEYRFPILYVDRGWGTIPFFLKNVSGAVFVDAGNAFDDVEGSAFTQNLIGTGAELRAYSVVGWGMGLYTRLGYGFAATGDGIPFGNPYGAYLSLGSSF